MNKYLKTHIYKHNKNTYRYVIFHKNDPYKKSIRIEQTGFKSKEEAQEALLLKQSEIALEENILDKKQRIGYLVNKFLEYRKPIIKPTSFHSQKLCLYKYLYNEYKNYSVSQFCREKNIKDFKDNLISNSNIKTINKNKIMSHIKICFRYGALAKIITNEQYSTVELNLSYLKPTETNKVKEKNYWSYNQFIKFINSIDSYWQVFFLMLGETGMRLGEIRGLQLKHYDPINKTIRIEQQAVNGVGSNRTIIAPPKTLSSIRTISLSNNLVETMNLYIKTIRFKNPNMFLFFNQSTPIGKTTIERNLNNLIDKIGLPHITPHGFRHSNTTWLLQQELTVQEIGQVSRRLGHSSVKMTLDIYMHIHNTESEKITNFFDNPNNKKQKEKYLEIKNYGKI